MKKTPIIDVTTGETVVKCEYCGKPMKTSHKLPYFGPGAASGGGAYICTNPKCPGKKPKCLRCGKPLTKYEQENYGSYCAQCNDYLEEQTFQFMGSPYY